jgi:SAM-dependent methyltransferase
MKPESTYESEPEDVFIPLPPAEYQRLYDLEMSDFSEDLQYYLTKLSGRRTILELGCGSGRLTRRLSQAGFFLIGCDISLPMLTEAKRKSFAEKYVCMDMQKTGFSRKFDSVIIPYNTLNLLVTPDAIRKCLENCFSLMQEGGQLLLQLFTPSAEIMKLAEGETSFQFQLFDNPGGGKVVKETLRQYDRTTRILTMTERYRIRPMRSLSDNINYFHTFHLFVPEVHFWSDILSSIGFTICDVVNEYSRDVCAGDGTFLIDTRKR